VKVTGQKTVPTGTGTMDTHARQVNTQAKRTAIHLSEQMHATYQILPTYKSHHHHQQQQQQSVSHHNKTTEKEEGLFFSAMKKYTVLEHTKQNTIQTNDRHFGQGSCRTGQPVCGSKVREVNTAIERSMTKRGRWKKKKKYLSGVVQFRYVPLIGNQQHSNCNTNEREREKEGDGDGDGERRGEDVVYCKYCFFLLLLRSHHSFDRSVPRKHGTIDTPIIKISNNNNNNNTTMNETTARPSCA